MIEEIVILLADGIHKGISCACENSLVLGMDRLNTAPDSGLSIHLHCEHPLYLQSQ